VKQDRTRQLAWLVTAGGRKRSWMVLGVVSLAALSVAAIATGKSVKISERSEDFTVDEVSDQREADCGSKRAVAGGFFAQFDQQSVVFPLVSAREGQGAWALRAALVEGDPGDATAYAYCAKKKRFPKLREGSGSDTISAGETESVTADCPGNRRAVSGGFQIPDSLIAVTTSMRSSRGSWTVEFYAFDGDNSEVEALVYCAKRLKLKQRSSEASVDEGEGGTSEASCKGKERVVSGGFDTDSNETSYAVGTVSRRVGKRGWEAMVFGQQGTRPLTVIAYCLKKPKKK
jgi:hypothetical protein